jgi:hypothetical protein
MIKKYIEEIKFLSSISENNLNLDIYKQNKEKYFYSNVKLDNKTRYYNTAFNDNLTPTMSAYYFCDKSRQILSDKEAAAMKAMNLDNNFDILGDDNMIHVGGMKYGRNKDDDQVIIYIKI